MNYLRKLNPYNHFNLPILTVSIVSSVLYHNYKLHSAINCVLPSTAFCHQLYSAINCIYLHQCHYINYILYLFCRSNQSGVLVSIRIHYRICTISIFIVCCFRVASVLLFLSYVASVSLHAVCESLHILCIYSTYTNFCRYKLSS